MKPSDSKRNWALLAWAFVTLLLGLTCSIKSRHDWHSFRSAALTAQGTVSKATMGWKTRDDSEPPRIEYQFWVEGKQFSGEGEEYVPEGETVEIAYLPDKPESNTLADDRDDYFRSNLIAFVACVVGALQFCIGFSKKTCDFLNALGYEAKFNVTSFPRFPVIVVGGITGSLIIIRFLNAQEVPEDLLRWAVVIACVLLLIPVFKWGPQVFTSGLIIILIRYNPVIPIEIHSNLMDLLDLAFGCLLLFIVANIHPPSDTQAEASK